MAKRKKWLKWGLILLGIFVSLLVIGFLVVNEPRPIGVEGTAAEELAMKMQEAINQEAWNNTGAIVWNFDERRDLVWDKDRHFVKVSWDNYEVYLNIDEMQGTVYRDGVKLKEEEQQIKLLKAWEIWVNDSFWLNPVSKIYDPGTSRSLVNLSDGGDGLLVEYGKGGATPGDAYLWEVDDQGMPIKWQMWVSIIPIGGLDATWEGWIETKTGVKISTLHKIGKRTLRLHNVRTAENLVELMGEDIFQDKL